MEAIKERKFATMPSFVLGDESKVIYKNQNNDYDAIKNYIEFSSSDYLNFLHQFEISPKDIIDRLNLMKSILNQHDISYFKINPLIINENILRFDYLIEKVSVEKKIELENQFINQVILFENIIDHLVIINLKVQE